MSEFNFEPPAPTGAGDALPPAAPAVEAPVRWHLPKAALAIAILALAGAIVFFYPATAAWLSQYDQSKVVSELQAKIVSTGATSNELALAAARSYNNELVSGAQLAANARKPVSGGDASADDKYDRLLVGDASGAMGRLSIPKISVDLPIYHGTSDETLAKGVGHLQGTSLPVGGESQHSVLTAHRGLAEATLFDNLDKLAIGDRFQISVFGEVLSYRIIETKVVAPENTESLFPRLGDDLVTLVTCTPLGINTHRILVTGERILPTPIGDVQSASATPDIPGFPWWAVGLTATVVVAGGYVWLMGKPAKPKHAADRRKAHK